MIACPNCRTTFQEMPEGRKCASCGFEPLPADAPSTSKPTIVETLQLDNEPHSDLSFDLNAANSDMSGKLKRTLADGDANLDFSMNAPDMVSRAEDPSHSGKTLPDVATPRFEGASDLGSTLAEGDVNLDFSIQGENAPSNIEQAAPSGLSSSAKTLADIDPSTTIAEDRLGQTMPEADSNADFLLGQPNLAPIVPPAVNPPQRSNATLSEDVSEPPRSRGNLNQTLPETDFGFDFSRGDVDSKATATSLDDAALSSRTLPDGRPTQTLSDLGKTIDDSAGVSTKTLTENPRGAANDSSTKTLADDPKSPVGQPTIVGTVSGSAIDLKDLSIDLPGKHPQPPRSPADLASMKTMADPGNAGMGNPRNLGATVDEPSQEQSQTLDFSADGLKVPISSTIHVHSNQVTVGEVSLSVANAKTRKGGATQNAQNDSVDGADDEFLLKSISKRSLASEGTTSTGIVTPDYKIVKKLGEGGMGVVYAAVQKSLDRQVAVKAIKGGAAVSKDSRRKFFYEARITGDLDHPNIVPIHEIGTQDDGTLFYSMKMVDGTPWQDVIKAKSKEENLEIFMKVCDAVAIDHSRNVIHRALKPENVMMGAFGEVLVMDWGLAIQMPPTRPFGMSGTPAYMSPEMARHDVGSIGKGSDIYILGGILYELVSGNAPHTGANVRECLMNAIKNEIVPTDIEDPLIDIARHAMSASVEDRYSSVIEMQEAIREVMRHAESISLSKRAEDWLEMAERHSDYQGFSRALFSMQEAIDLWPGNRAAQDGIVKAKFAYGSSALSKGDYDLCLQVLDPAIESHAEQMQIARERKAANLQREARLKFTKRVLGWVVSTAAISLSILTAYAFWQAEIAKQARSDALDSASAAISARKDAELQRDSARTAEANARSAEAKEAKAKVAAEEAKTAAENAEKIAVDLKEEALKLKEKAENSAREAIEQSRIAILGSYQSKMTLANAQSTALEIPQSSQSLRDIQSLATVWPASPNPEESKRFDPAPDAVREMLSNWALRRIQYFNNEDLPRLSGDSKIVAMDYDPNSGTVVAADSQHRIRWLKTDSAQLQWDPDRTVVSKDPIRGLAIAPGGEKVVLLHRSSGDESSAQLLIPSTGAISDIEGLDRKPLQKAIFTNHGKWLFGGINTGLWSWRVLEDGLASPSIITFRGAIESLHGLGGDKSDYVFGISRLPQSNVSCFVANLASESVAVINIPTAGPSKLATATMTPDGGAIILGYEDGNVVPIRVVWNTAPDKNGNAALRIDLAEDLVAQVEEYESLKVHRTRVEDIQCLPDGSVLTRASEPVVPLWQLTDRYELAPPNFVTGLSGTIQQALFTNGGRSVIACDATGTVMQWNRNEQLQRSGELLLHTPVMKDRPAVEFVHAVFDEKLNPFAVDQTGTIVSRTISGESQSQSILHYDYVGHTPFSNVIGAATADSKPWIATLARLSRNAKSYLGSEDFNVEVCVWNVGSGQMVARVPLPTGLDSRIAFLDSDRRLGVCDGKTFRSIDTETWKVDAAEDRFSTVLAIEHPTQRSLVTLVANSGAVRLFDFRLPASWDDENLRDFDLAINNRALPVQAIWSSDGKRLFVLFDNGAMARLVWENGRFAEHQWSKSLVSGIDAESELAWNFVDFNLVASDPSVDRLRIAKRTSDTRSKSEMIAVTWARDASEPSVDQSESLPGNHYWVAGQATPWSVAREYLESQRDAVRQVVNNAAGEVLLIEDNGSIRRLDTRNPAAGIKAVGQRSECIAAASDATGRLWVTLHQGDAVWVAVADSVRGYRWWPIEHPFKQIRNVEIDREGKRIWLFGRDAQDQSAACTYVRSVDGNPWRLESTETGIVRAIQSPASSDWVGFTADNKLQRLSWPQGTLMRQDLAMPEDRPLDSQAVSRMAWFRQRATSESIQEWSLMILSKSDAQSVIDWLPWNTTTEQFESGFRSTVNGSEVVVCPSPEGNIFVSGDETGTLLTWFASPQLEKQARQLFNLPKHSGSRIRSVQFAGAASDNLDSLISADSAGRVFGWYTERGKPGQVIQPLVLLEDRGDAAPRGRLVGQQ
ncbi:MAG: serine/threonine-protein kinase [Pirellula sp.]